MMDATLFKKDFVGTRKEAVVSVAKFWAAISRCRIRGSFIGMCPCLVISSVTPSFPA